MHRAVWELNDRKERTFWELWSLHWKWVMQSGNQLRTLDYKAWHWDRLKDTHVESITCEDVDPAKTVLIKQGWDGVERLARQIREVRNDLKKTFFVDGDRDAFSAGFAVPCLIHKWGFRDVWDSINIPLFEGTDTGKEITITSSGKMMEGNVKEAVLSSQHIKDHSLRIGGAKSYATFPRGGSIIPGLLGPWASGVKRTYMHAHWLPLELARLAVAIR